MMKSVNKTTRRKQWMKIRCYINVEMSVSFEHHDFFLPSRLDTLLPLLVFHVASDQTCNRSRCKMVCRRWGEKVSHVSTWSDMMSRVVRGKRETSDCPSLSLQLLQHQLMSTCCKCCCCCPSRRWTDVWGGRVTRLDRRRVERRDPKKEVRRTQVRRRGGDDGRMETRLRWRVEENQTLSAF